jgi:class 3 adenylate cyclase/predicted ATPase
MTSTVTEWLTELGLAQYATVFAENDIDEEVLTRLTAEDLRDLGVTSVGHRRRLLDAISALCGVTPSHPEREAAAEPLMREAAAEPERRQLTVMFCDLVGSTALSTRLDPEDLREMIGAYHSAAAVVVGRFGGFIAKYMGDGVLVYFGYPQAHEDDAERAIRAGLAAIGAISELHTPEPLQVRLGIATGLVVVGDLIGAGAAQERGVVGETPNLAARLQTLAVPNSLVVAETTRRQVGSLFDMIDLGPRELAGFAEPQQIWQVLGESGMVDRFEALRSLETPMVGREDELALLRRRWQQARAGEGRVVLVSGEPGIGKSRLTAALSLAIADDPHACARYFCSPYHQDSALHPFIVQLERAARFQPDDTPEEKLDKLRAILSSRESVELLADLLSLPNSVAELGLTPQRKRQQTFTALLNELEALTRRQPVLAVFEDTHWIDPTSRELLDLVIANVHRWPVLLIITFRPEFVEAWSGQPQVTTLALNRLGASERAALVKELVGEVDLGAETIAEIIDRTDGVPLFVEELTKAVLESSDRAARVAEVLSATTRSARDVPATLHASLMARLDRLGGIAKEIAQIGAVLGREFTYDLIEPVAAHGQKELQTAVGQLSEAGLLFCSGAPPHASYLFKHALVQDAAYGTLLRRRRQELHGRVADALLSTGSASFTASPEIVAHHLQNAGRSAEAVEYWQQAGAQAVRAAANREAVAHFRRAPTLLEAQPPTAPHRRVELAILSQLGPALMSLHGWSAPEVGEVVERAAEIGRQLESSPDLAPAIANLWIFNTARGRLDRAEEISADVTRIARELDDPEILLQAHHCAWATHYHLGRFEKAREHISAGAALYDEARHVHHRHVYLGHDPGVCLLNFDASLRIVLGYPQQALRLAKKGVELARRLGHAPSLGNALWRGAQNFAWQGDTATVIAYTQELLTLSESYGLPLPRAHAMNYLGWALSHDGQSAAGIARIEERLNMLVGMGARVHLNEALCLSAESLLLVGRWREGLERTSRAFDLLAETEERWPEARLHRLHAELLMQSSASRDAVEASLRQAIDVARQQGAKGWELGAATSLARYWGEQGRRAEAFALLSPVYGWFTEGFETPDLKAAKTLLDTLA